MSNISIFVVVVNLPILLQKEQNSIFYWIRSRNVCCELLNYNFITAVSCLCGRDESLICIIETGIEKKMVFIYHRSVCSPSNCFNGAEYWSRFWD